MNLNKSKEPTLVSNYRKPDEQIIDLNEELRALKINDKKERDLIREQYIYANPKASNEKADGAVFRLAYENKLKKN